MCSLIKALKPFVKLPFFGGFFELSFLKSFFLNFPFLGVSFLKPFVFEFSF